MNNHKSNVITSIPFGSGDVYLVLDPESLNVSYRVKPHPAKILTTHTFLQLVHQVYPDKAFHITAGWDIEKVDRTVFQLILRLRDLYKLPGGTEWLSNNALTLSTCALESYEKGSPSRDVVDGIITGIQKKINE